MLHHNLLLEKKARAARGLDVSGCVAQMQGLFNLGIDWICIPEGCVFSSCKAGDLLTWEIVPLLFLL